MFRLTKLKLAEGQDSMVPTGYSSTLPNCYLGRGDEKKEIHFCDQLEVGKQVVLLSICDYHVTSPITKILEQDVEEAVFTTQTSLYKLERVSDDVED